MVIQGKIEFKNANEEEQKIPFIYHYPFHLNKFLPKESNIIEYIRKFFSHLKKIGYEFSEVTHNKQMLCVLLHSCCILLH